MNRYTTQFVNTIAKGVTKIFANVTIGATGAPTLVTSGFVSQGVVSVTRVSAGLYTFVFGTQAGMLDSYYKLLGVNVMFNTIGTSGVVPAAPLWAVVANSVSTSASCSLQVQFYNTSGTATDPASGEALYLEFTFKNSTAP